MIKPVEDALKKVPNRFLLATVVSRRWEGIVAGRPPLVDSSPGEPRIDVVLREILDDCIELDYDERTLNLVGTPEAEESDETFFSEAFKPDAASVQEIVGGADGTGGSKE